MATLELARMKSAQVQETALTVEPSQLLLIISLSGKLVFQTSYSLLKEEFFLENSEFEYVVRIIGKEPGSLIQTTVYGSGNSFDLAAEVAADEFYRKIQDAGLFIATVNLSRYRQYSEDIFRFFPVLCDYYGCDCDGVLPTYIGTDDDGNHAYSCSHREEIAVAEHKHKEVAKLLAAYSLYEKLENRQFPLAAVRRGTEIDLSMYVDKWKQVKFLDTVKHPGTAEYPPTVHDGLAILAKSLAALSSGVVRIPRDSRAYQSPPGEPISYAAAAAVTPSHSGCTTVPVSAPPSAIMQQVSSLLRSPRKGQLSLTAALPVAGSSTAPISGTLSSPSAGKSVHWKEATAGIEPDVEDQPKAEDSISVSRSEVTVTPAKVSTVYDKALAEFREAKAKTNLLINPFGSQLD